MIRPAESSFFATLAKRWQIAWNNINFAAKTVKTVCTAVCLGFWVPKSSSDCRRNRSWSHTLELVFAMGISEWEWESGWRVNCCFSRRRVSHCPPTRADDRPTRNPDLVERGEKSREICIICWELRLGYKHTHASSAGRLQNNAPIFYSFL